MTIPQHPPHQDDVMKDLQQALDREIGGVATARVGPPASRPAVPAAPPGPAMWGPSSPRVTSPLATLVTLADNAASLQTAIETLLTDVTGEPSPIRTRTAPKLPPGLFPAIQALTAEIAHAHSQIGQLVQHLRGRL